MNRLVILGLLFLAQTIDAGRNCLGHTGRKLREVPWVPVRCDCNCDQQQKVTYDQGHGYGCVRCGHRLIPKDVMTKENTTVIKSKTKKTGNTVQHQTSTQRTKRKSKQTT